MVSAMVLLLSNIKLLLIANQYGWTMETRGHIYKKRYKVFWGLKEEKNRHHIKKRVPQSWWEEDGKIMCSHFRPPNHEILQLFISQLFYRA